MLAMDRTIAYSTVFFTVMRKQHLGSQYSAVYIYTNAKHYSPYSDAKLRSNKERKRTTKRETILRYFDKWGIIFYSYVFCY